MAIRDSQLKAFGLVEYKPHEKQLLYHASEARFKVAVCGRRFGKSAMAARDKLDTLLNPSKPVRGWIVAPTYVLGEKEFRYLWNDLVIALKLGSQLKRKAYNMRSGEMYIEFPWGSRVDVKSADHPDGLVGEGLDWVILAEAAKLNVNVWDKYIRPSLADRHGTADFVTTPEGYNWIYELYQRGADDSQREWESFHYPSWCNPYVYPGGRDDPEILEMERNNYDAWFKQEIGAEFTAFAGRIYSEFDDETHTDNWAFDPRVPNFTAYDFGYTNPFVRLDIQVTPSEEVHVWREYYKTQEPVHRHAEILKHMPNPEGYHIEFGTGDPADPGAIQTLNDYGLGPIFGNPDCKDWDLGVHEIKKLLNPSNPRLFVSKACKELIWELHNYRTKDSKVQNNENSQEQPKKYADHGLDALRYFVMHRFVLGAGYHLESIYNDVYGRHDEPQPDFDNDDGGMFTLAGEVF